MLRAEQKFNRSLDEILMVQSKNDTKIEAIAQTVQNSIDDASRLYFKAPLTRNQIVDGTLRHEDSVVGSSQGFGQRAELVRKIAENSRN